MYPRGPVPVRASTAPASDGLVVAEAFDVFALGVSSAVAEGEIVAVALGGSAGLEGFEDDVGNALALGGPFSSVYRSRRGEEEDLL